MKVSASVEIGKPPSEVFHFITDIENMPLWMSNFLRAEAIDGAPDEVGSIAKYFFTQSGRTMEMTAETISKTADSAITTLLKNDLAEVQVHNKIEPIGRNHTLYTQTIDYTPKAFAFRAWLLFFGNALPARQREDLERLREAMEALSDYEVE
jgi:uncharacterized membrane protein